MNTPAAPKAPTQRPPLSPPYAGEVTEALRRELHRVRGAAGSLGFPDASRLAGVLEARATGWILMAKIPSRHSLAAAGGGPREAE